MTRGIQDEDVRLLAGLASTLQGDYISPQPDPWIGSPFAWIRVLPSRQKGKIGEQLVAGWCAAKGMGVGRTGDAEADLIVNGVRTEIKCSMLWASGVYTFQQFRDQDYDQAICLGIAPFEAAAWVVPKAVLAEHFAGRRQLDHLKHQHGGKAGSDTWWLSFDAKAPPRWLGPFGGTLAMAYRILSRPARR